MECQVKEVIIPSFINAHLFWIIEKGDILLRTAMNKIMTAKPKKSITNLEQINESQMVCVNIEGLWARAIVEKIVQTQDGNKLQCWLPDYGIMRSVRYVFPLPDGLEKCPHLAKQASLHNVVNLTMDLLLGSNGYELQEKKTVNEIAGIRLVATDSIDKANRVFFTSVYEDDYNVYGDVTIEHQDAYKESLTEFLKEKKLIAEDEEMFERIEPSRNLYKKTYYQNSANWEQPLDRIEPFVSRIVFNYNEKVTMV